MWLEDVFSFECVFRFLNLAEVNRLKLVDKTFRDRVTDMMSRCRAVHTIDVGDIRFATNPAIFPNLESFQRLVINRSISAEEVNRLLDRWSNWDSCQVSTRNHTRKALRRLLGRVKNLKSLHIHIDGSRCNVNALVKSRSAFHEMLRHNRSSLQHISMWTPRLYDFVVTTLRNSRVSSISLFLENTCQYDLACIVNNLPCTVHSMSIEVGSSYNCSGSAHPAPYFLSMLARKSHIKRLKLINCVMICSIECESWDCVRQFCSDIEVDYLEMSVLRDDCMEILRNRCIPSVMANVVSRKSHLSAQ